MIFVKMQNGKHHRTEEFTAAQNFRPMEVQIVLNDIAKEGELLILCVLGNQFNGDFENLVKRCCRSMYLMISHVLHAHHFFLSENKIDTSFIDLFAYLITFVREFSLMDRKDLPALEQVEFTLSRYS